MEFNHLDHRLLFVNTEFYNQPIVVGASGQPKRFEARWLREEKFNQKVMDAWIKVVADPLVTSVYEKLNRMHTLFHDWDQ